VSDRIRHFRAGLLLALSTIVVILPISYWFPLSDYLVALGAEDYADYKQTLELIMGIYAMFFILNLINVGLSATKLNYRIKIWLSLIPAFVLLVVPVLLVIPIANKFPKQSFFEIFQALYSLLRFNSVALLWWSLILTVVAVALNVRAAITLKNSPNPEHVPKHLSNRYLIYAGVMLLVFAVVTLVSMNNAYVRASDRKACLEYSTLALPEYDDQVDAYISDVRVISEGAGSKNLKKQFTDFSDLSVEYLSLAIAEPESATKLAQYGEAIAAVKASIDLTCAEFSVK